MIGVDHHHSFIVRDNHAIEAQRIPQEFRQDAFRSSHELAIQLRIGVHHRHQTRVADCGLEGCHVDVPKVSLAQMHRAAIQPPLRKSMPNEMLARRHYGLGRILPLQPLDVGFTKLAHQ